MTAQQIILLGSAYLIELAVVVYFTRATARRVVGAVVGAAAAGLLAMGAIILCEALGWWRVSFASTLYFLPLFYLGLASLTPIYLVTWRLVRRFGWRGLAVFIGIVTIIGPPRDYLIAAKSRSGWYSHRASLLCWRMLRPMPRWCLWGTT